MLNKLNEAIAARITSWVGTMWCAYAFAGLALISLPQAIHSGTAALIAWIAQTFLQLVLLPLIMVGSDVLSRKAELRAIQDHETLMEELALLKKIHELLENARV